jgi:choline-glycine betaine transporter
MTNGLRNHPGPTRIRSYADEQRWQRRHRLFWAGYWIALAVAVAALIHAM